MFLINWSTSNLLVAITLALLVLIPIVIFALAFTGKKDKKEP